MTTEPRLRGNTDSAADTHEMSEEYRVKAWPRRDDEEEGGGGDGGGGVHVIRGVRVAVYGHMKNNRNVLVTDTLLPMISARIATERMAVVLK